MNKKRLGCWVAADVNFVAGPSSCLFQYGRLSITENAHMYFFLFSVSRSAQLVACLPWNLNSLLAHASVFMGQSRISHTCDHTEVSLAQLRIPKSLSAHGFCWETLSPRSPPIQMYDWYELEKQMDVLNRSPESVRKQTCTGVFVDVMHLFWRAFLTVWALWWIGLSYSYFSVLWIYRELRLVLHSCNL